MVTIDSPGPQVGCNLIGLHVPRLASHWPVLMSLCGHFVFPQEPLTANETNTVTCTSYGSNPPAVISWWLDGVKISNMESQVTLEHNSNSTNSVLKFVPHIGDAGKFLKCRAENIEMTASQLEDSRSLEMLVNF